MTDDVLFPDRDSEQNSLGNSAAKPAAGEVDPLDVPQRFTDVSSYQVREEFQQLVVRDLLGPWDGEVEVFRPRAMGPRERYLVGMLGPKHTPRSTVDDADAVSDTESGVHGDARGEEGGELPDILTPQNLGRIWASSMGLSFCVGAGIDAVVVTATWGRYFRRETEDSEGRARSAWTREPMVFEREVRLDGDADYRVPLTAPDLRDPCAYLAVGVRPEVGNRRTVQVTLVNGQQEPLSNADTAWIFQARLTVTALDGTAPIFMPIDDPLADADPHPEDHEDLHLRLLYRDQLKFATGHNVAVHADTEPAIRRAHRLETTWLPTYDVPATIAQVGEGTSLARTELSMDALADADLDTLRAGLSPLADGYAEWLDQREAKIPGLPEGLKQAANAAVSRARVARQRVQAGIELLTNPDAPGHDQALQAFRFANRAMAAQRRHTEIARRREDPTATYADAEAEVQELGARAASWRPFQLAFVLLNLPALTDPDHRERAANHDATVDLLFFPTGGGKTEAYLGLTAYTFAIRRLQGIIGSGEQARHGGAGVAVLMRYTLRLLTAQQFQRAAALVCAAEVLRRDDEDTWGREPFRIGLWVGGTVSPNWFDQAEEQVAEAREAGHGHRANVLQTLSCPWCGAKVEAYRDVHVDADVRRIYLYCPNAEGAACPFSRTQSAEGLPILTVDEEIYRLAPSLIIATVDKLAQLPWRGFAGILFGRARQYCPRHGFRHDDLDARTGCGGKHNKKGKWPPVVSLPVPRLRPPDLIIQDELHLISGALGTTVGLFEAAVDELCTWTTPAGTETGPKIVASTATTKRARDQVRGVFGRGLEIFPPQVTEVTDTFFSKQVPVTQTNPGRRYLGVCAHGVRLKSAEIRLAEILLIAGQTMFDTHGETADPYMTLVGYFNATRELAGMRRYLDDDVTTRVRRHGRSKGLSDRIVGATAMLTIQELTSRISSGDISDVLKRLEIGFDAELDTSMRRRAINDNLREVINANKGKSSRSKDRLALHPITERWSDRRKHDRGPVDVVLATSMLQVGVDVSRFGLMVVTGQPKNTAEYIQASSRVGRDPRRPGLVVTLLNWTRPRDLAHYEDFEHYHATFYRQVEALSVTPYTRRALDRGSTATFVAAVRNIVEHNSRNTDAHDVALDAPVVRRVIDRLLTRADVVGGERGRGYMDERIKSLTNLWSQAKTGSTRLGYEKGTFNRQLLIGLLSKPGEGRWTDTTVGMSMRETENEINLLLPGGGEFYQPTYNAPAWSFAPPNGDADEEEIPDGDEMGDSDLTEPAERPDV